MAGGRGLGKEVIQGVGGAFVAIVICVAIGSFIAQALSPGHQAPAEEQKTEAAAEPAKAEEAAAAEGEPKADEAKAEEGAAQ